jgi:hypothetical protein
MGSGDIADPAALRVIHLLEDERVLRTWRTPLGLLVMTNLRCVEVVRHQPLFSKGEWALGPSFFFYNMAPPKVLFNRYLRLSDTYEENPVVAHVFVHNPAQVAQELQRARLAGQNEWLRRRARAEESYRLSRVRWTSGNRVILHSAEGEVIKVRCSYCGNLMDASTNRCPSCGAPQL